MCRPARETLPASSCCPKHCNWLQRRQVPSIASTTFEDLIWMPSETNVPQLLDLGTRQPGKPGQRRQGDSICRSLGAADALTHVVSHHSRQGQHIRAECNRRSTEAAAAVNWGTQPPGTSASSPTCWRSPSKIAAKVTPGAQQPRKPCQPLPSASSLSQSLTVSRGLSALACM